MGERTWKNMGVRTWKNMGERTWKTGKNQRSVFHEQEHPFFGMKKPKNSVKI